MNLIRDVVASEVIVYNLSDFMAHVSSPFYSMRWAVITALEGEHRV